MNSGPLIISFAHYKTAVLKVRSTSQFLQNQIGLEGLLHWPLVLQSHTLLSDAKLEAIHTTNSKVLS
jgi:hypothetical protein